MDEIGQTELSAEVPSWVRTEVYSARRALGIPPAWFISIDISDKPHGLEYRDAAVYCDSSLFMAWIEIKPSVTKDDKRLIWHEVAHILMSPMADAARVGMNEIKNSELRSFAIRRYNDIEEQTIQNLIYGLFIP